MRIWLYSALLLCVAAGAVRAQGRKEPFNYVGKESASRVEAPPPGIRLALSHPREFALLPLSQAERAKLAEPGLLRKIGIHRALGPNALQTGSWMTAVDGTQVWRMAIRSPGSKGIRLEFQNFDAGSGRVWVHDGVHTAGPYTGKGLFDNGHFWSAPIQSESVTVEYQGPALDSGTPPFEIVNLAHQAYSTGNEPWGTADYCNLDPNCYAEWQPAMKMVGEMIFEADGGEAACTGTLVATRDNSAIPYLLTAGHCINSEDQARSLVVDWTYQTPSCGGTPPADPSGSTKSQGAHLVSYATIDQGDYSLVLLQSIPAGVTFSGWDPAEPGVGSDLTGVHHPNASYKRISFGNRTPDQAANVEGNLAPANLYYQIQWAHGVTEPGSSGSGLFSSPGVLTGTLTYGPASDQLTACELLPATAGYGRFSNTYTALKDYFENIASSLVKPANDVSFTVNNHSTPAAQTVALTTQTAGQVSYKLRADAPWIVLGANTGTLSNKSPASANIQVDPTTLQQPGTYVSTVTILSGAAPPQYINVTVKVTASQSNVQLQVTPNPVYQSNGVWTFTISLNETGGAGTTVTGMHVNGADYSSNIAAWFGSTHINAKASVQDTLHASGLIPGNQTFEFWGVDDASGTTWYRTLTVNFQ